MALTVAELGGEAQRVFHAQQSAQNVLFGLRHAAVRRGGIPELMQCIVIPLPGGTARQSNLADIAFVVVLILRSTSQRIGAGLKLRVLPDGDFFPAQRVKAAGDQAIFVIPVVGFTAFGIKFLLGCLCAGLSASLSACSPVAGKTRPRFFSRFPSREGHIQLNTSPILLYPL